jgi:ADP-heptose:LPS heptosyltransferase
VLRPGGLGDLVCADIALQELGREARDYTWLIENRSRPWALYRGLPHLCYDEQPHRMMAQIWRRYSLVINSEQLFGLAQATALAARAAGGRLVAFATVRGARRSDLVVPYDWRDRHETLSFADLFAAAHDQPAPTLSRSPRPRVVPAELPPLVLIAGRQSASRSLELDQWLRLIHAWLPDRPYVVAAAPADAAFADELNQRSAGKGGRFAGNFAQLCDHIARSAEVLTMDGGPVHIASYFGVPSTVIFTSGRSRKWAPLGAGSRLIRRHDLPCQPCTKFGQVPPCPYRYRCLHVDDQPATPAP